MYDTLLADSGTHPSWLDRKCFVTLQGSSCKIVTAAYIEHHESVRLWTENGREVQNHGGKWKSTDD